MVIEYGMIAAKHFSLNKGIVVLPLTILFIAISLGGAYLIHNITEWLLLIWNKKQTLNYSS